MKTHVFHKNTATVSKGLFLDNTDGCRTLLVTIKGSTTSHKVEFKFMNAAGDLEAMAGMKPTDYSMATSTTGANESWLFGIDNMKRIYMDITAIVPGAGSLTIIGEAGY